MAPSVSVVMTVRDKRQSKNVRKDPTGMKSVEGAKKFDKRAKVDGFRFRPQIWRQFAVRRRNGCARVSARSQLTPDQLRE